MRFFKKTLFLILKANHWVSLSEFVRNAFFTSIAPIKPIYDTLK